MAPAGVIDDVGDEFDFGDNVDQATFEQVLEMDEDDDDRDFSKGIVFGFFEQAETTFTKMDEAVEHSDLLELSRLGHFLKGSSATLGLIKIKDACEKIQHFGAHKDETGTADEPDDKVCLDGIKVALQECKSEYKEVSALLKRFYGEG